MDQHSAHHLAIKGETKIKQRRGMTKHSGEGLAAIDTARPSNYNILDNCNMCHREKGEGRAGQGEEAQPATLANNR